MNKDQLLENIELNSPPSTLEIENFLNKFDFSIDPDYLEFLRVHDGGEGFLTNNNFISLWTVSDLLDMNPYYDHDHFCDNVIILGSNGSDIAYGMTKIDHTYFYAPYIGMSEEVKYLGNSFWTFLEKISDASFM